MKTLYVIAFLASVVWFCASPDYEPAITATLSLAALIGHSMLERRQSTSSQKLSVSKNSIGIQAGGDVKINATRRSEDE